MSYSVDVNILLYASTNGSPFHEKAARFLDECAASRDVFYLGWPTIMGYLRLSTHPSIVEHPLTPERAMDNVDALLRLPQVRVLAEQEGFFAYYRSLAGRVAVRGNLVPDAHLAALLLQNGVTTLYTNDVDFRKFDGLKVKNPLR